MPRALFCLALAAICALLAACSSGDDADPTPAPTASPTVIPSPTEPPTPEPSPTPQVVRQDIRANHLLLPTIGLDAAVQGSQTIPYVYVPPQGCPDRGSEETQTVTVPNQGIATPEEELEGLENKTWIFGHSRWLGAPGLFLSLQDLAIGDEVIIDGTDRTTGEALTGLRFVVDGLYLADTDSGELFLNAETPEDIPPRPIVILQTSVREDGAGKAWLLDQQTLLDKAVNTVEGDLDDPCKYLLLFVTASPAS